ncbi:Protein FAR1-RELATED SEQUENCE 5 [Glycine soja]
MVRVINFNGFFVCDVEIFECLVKMDKDQWMYDNIMFEEVDMNEQNEDEVGVNEEHVHCSDVFATRDDVLHWAIAYGIGFVAVIMRSNINTGMRGRISFVLIGCERSSNYRSRKKDFERRDISSRKYGCPLMARDQGWMVKLICGSHNYEMAKPLDEKTIIADMTKSMVKSRNILLTLNEHNTNSYTTIKQIYNARSAYRSFIRDNDTEMQQLMKLLERDQYILWHRLKDENFVHDIFWCHPDAVKLCNVCNLVFFIDSTYKTNRYRLPLFDFVGVTPTGMTFSVGFVYLEGEHLNNFRGLFLRRDALPRIIVTDRDLALMNAMKIVFPKCTNLLCRFHIDKNVKVMHLGNTTTNRIEFSHWALKRLLQNSLGNLCSIWKAMNSTLGYLTWYKIVAEFERVYYVSKNSSRCGCVMRTTHGFSCACELSKYVVSTIPLETIHMFWRRLSFSDQGLYEPQVTITKDMETISKRFEELDVCDKVTLKSKLREIVYPKLNSMCPPPEKVKTKGAQKKPMTKHQRSIKHDPSY